MNQEEQKEQGSMTRRTVTEQIMMTGKTMDSSGRQLMHNPKQNRISAPPLQKLLDKVREQDTN
ncbi:hypothetical protein C922_03602 [Plasmodium inui San Antonio 1]|uniref:Uncharacterized protein n=1 Tax=Plasmodium inui San Antonio 1 TaxID=1237626 RepID=W7A3F2_9APIC|nr:hypothetical protein C922_03602 [Plasmodium inui San Antonio 1]EUD65878.1 hypothetical protein C922_03602 [Plasmodium inui San Antonio 1]